MVLLTTINDVYYGHPGGDCDHTMETIPNRRVIALVIGGAALLSGYLIHSKVRQARRDDAYNASLAPYQHDLHIGMSRKEVQKYLHVRNMDYHEVGMYGSGPETIVIRIGEDPSTLVCEWDVYVALEFSTDDELREAHIRKSGTCL